MPLEDRPSTGDSQAEPRATVMVVDDEAAVRRVLVMRLQLAGYRVICAEDGEEALTLFHQEQPDLIVLDVMLPDINGKEVCQRVRSDSALDDVRIICISGMVEQDKIQDLKDSGADQFIQKPFEVDHLIDRICRLLDIEQLAT